MIPNRHSACHTKDDDRLAQCTMFIYNSERRHVDNAQWQGRSVPMRQCKPVFCCGCERPGVRWWEATCRESSYCFDCVLIGLRDNGAQRIYTTRGVAPRLGGMLEWTFQRWMRGRWTKMSFIFYYQRENGKEEPRDKQMAINECWVMMGGWWMVDGRWWCGTIDFC